MIRQFAARKRTHRSALLGGCRHPWPRRRYFLTAKRRQQIEVCHAPVFSSRSRARQHCPRRTARRPVRIDTDRRCSARAAAMSCCLLQARPRLRRAPWRSQAPLLLVTPTMVRCSRPDPRPTDPCALVQLCDNQIRAVDCSHVSLHPQLPAIRSEKRFDGQVREPALTVERGDEGVCEGR